MILSRNKKSPGTFANYCKKYPAHLYKDILNHLMPFNKLFFADHHPKQILQIGVSVTKLSH